MPILSVTSIEIYENLAQIVLAPGNISYMPGQFFMLSIPGWGEAPFTPTNFPDTKSIEFLIRRTGTLTEKIQTLKKNDKLTLRGPYGKSFPIDKMKGKNIALVAGGCGLAPIKGLLEYLIKNSNDFANIQLFYGVNSPKEISYKKDLLSMKKKIELIIAVANPDAHYHGNVGFVDKFITKNTILKNTVAILCGPPPMYQAVIKKIMGCGVTVDDIYVQLERRMHCGVGLCQHCTCGTKYVCKDGPAFSYREILKMDKLGEL